MSISSPRILLTLIVLSAFGLMLWASFGDSATFDEVAHISAGYSYVKLLDYRLNPEHPPLIKALSGIPLLFKDINFPTNHPGWAKEINGQWTMGSEFLYHAGNDANSIIRWSRLFPILITLLLIIFIYFWSKELMGPEWALLPAFLFALSPNVLAHGHYVTTDVGAALGIVAATYFFTKFLDTNSKKHLLLAGLTLGLAQLAKFSTALIIPLFFLLLLLHFSIHNKTNFLKSAFRYLKSFVLILFIAYAFVVYPAYALLVSNFPKEKQMETTVNVLSSFGGGPTPEGETCKLKRCAAEFAFYLTEKNITRPAGYYLFGLLMIIQRASGGNNNYFWGENSSNGSPYYFPAVYGLKEPLAILALIFLAIILSIAWLLRSLFMQGVGWGYWKRLKSWLRGYFPEFAMLFFILIYWAQSIQSPLNIGYRHLMPVIPFTYILISEALSKWSTKHSLKIAVAGLAAAGLLFETTLVVPNFLSYFNPIGGGSDSGYKYATDSNYDWGQDLLRLKRFTEENNIPKIAIDYFGGGEPNYYFGNKSENWWSAKGNPKDYGINWLAVSANTLQGSMQPISSELTRKPEDEYRWLKDLRPPKEGWGELPPPDYRIGNSIFIYKF